MIELKVLIDDVDYDSVAEFLIPLLAESMGREQKGGILGGVLAGNPEMITSMARKLLHTMTQDKRDELLVQLVNKNREKASASGSATSPRGNSENPHNAGNRGAALPCSFLYFCYAE